MNLVIHLAERTDRLETMVSNLDYFCGKDNWKVIDGVRDNIGAIGISKAFRNAITVLKDNNCKIGTIFEDDIKILSLESKIIWEKAKDQLPDDFDILLGGAYAHVIEETYSDNLLKIKNFSGFHCIYVSERCYDKFLQHTPEINGEPLNIDSYISTLGLNVYLCNPTVAMQYDTYSNNIRVLNAKSVNLDAKSLKPVINQINNIVENGRVPKVMIMTKNMKQKIYNEVPELFDFRSKNLLWKDVQVIFLMGFEIPVFFTYTDDYFVMVV